MSAGRPRKANVVSLGKIGKAKRLEKEMQEKAVRLERDALSAPPPWLNEEAKEEFLRVVTEAGRINLLDNLDLMAVAIYAENYARFIKAAKQLQEQGDTVITDNGEAASPFISIMKRAEDSIMRCSAKLGLFTTDRLKLIAPVKEEKSENKFLRFLK